MDSTQEYMNRMFAQLDANYRDSKGHVAHCFVISLDLAKRLEHEGKKPSIVTVSGLKNSPCSTELLQPRKYSGRVSWGSHQLCIVDRLAYDPMVSRNPTRLEDYLKEAFTKPAQESDVTINFEEIRELIQRDKSSDKEVFGY